MRRAIRLRRRFLEWWPISSARARVLKKRGIEVKFNRAYGCMARRNPMPVPAFIWNKPAPPKHFESPEEFRKFHLGEWSGPWANGEQQKNV